VKRKIIIGTRASKLALWQANHIAQRLRERHPDLEVVLNNIVTTGDKILDVPLAQIGGKGLFTKELENAMLSGEIDLAVHSLKDMPTQLPKGLILSAITARIDCGDAFVSRRYNSLDELPLGAKVGTSSLRRRAQLLKYRSDLTIEDLRGNIDTRLRKLEEGAYDAIILAVAGLKRLGWEGHIRQILPREICLPAVGQGALALESRSDDGETLALIEFLNDEDTRVAAMAERAYLEAVEGGCQVPIGVYAEVNEAKLHIEAAILSVDGRRHIRESANGRSCDADRLGRELARRMLDGGGREILAVLR
jgi:hydroxymethylbilane synthase